MDAELDGGTLPDGPDLADVAEDVRLALLAAIELMRDGLDLAEERLAKPGALLGPVTAGARALDQLRAIVGPVDSSTLASGLVVLARWWQEAQARHAAQANPSSGGVTADATSDRVAAAGSDGEDRSP
jgi:hypothetical protein